MPASAKVGKKAWLAPLVLVSGVAVALYSVASFLFLTDGLGSLLRQLLSWQGLVAVVLCGLGYLCRAARWVCWMRGFAPDLPMAPALHTYICGFMLTPTPGNAGEALRGMLLPEPRPSLVQGATVFAAERLADLAALVLLALPVALHLLYAPRLGWLLFWGLLLAGGQAWGLWRRRGWLADRWAGRLFWGDLLALLRQHPARWAGLTLLAWAGQGLAAWLMAWQLGLDLGWLQASSDYAAAMVAGAASMLPAGLGGMEASYIALLRLRAVPLADAMALTLLVRLLTLWFAVALGLLAFSTRRLVLRAS